MTNSQEVRIYILKPLKHVDVPSYVYVGTKSYNYDISVIKEGFYAYCPLRICTFKTCNCFS